MKFKIFLCLLQTGAKKQQNVFTLLLSFTLSDFYKSSPALLQQTHFLLFHMPKNWPEMNMDVALDLNLAKF